MAESPHTSARNIGRKDARIEVMSHGTINNLLKKIIGLDVATIGQSSIKRAVDYRLRQTGLPDAESYLATLQSSDQELRALIEEVVVPETWFFRDSGPFTALRAYVVDEWIPTVREGSLRILSLPCSTGEEPYSIAMMLLDSGVDPSRTRVDGIDVSSRALAKARLGIYTKNSFRNTEIDYRERYFHAIDNGYELCDRVRAMVHFSHGNILSDRFMPMHEPYDVVFCRNLFIYFDRETQRSVVNTLHGLLRVGGLLFVGHSEASIIPAECFEPLGMRGSFGYRKRDPLQVIGQESVVLTPAVSKKDRSRSKGKQQELPLEAIQTAPSPTKSATVAVEVVAEDQLQRAHRLANEGFLEEAEQLCESTLQNDSACSDAYYLWGVVREAHGDHRHANELFRKAVYLDPNHHEALVHLALQAEAAGDMKAAEVLKKRAARAGRFKKG